MRKWVVALVLAGAALPAMAAKKLSVGELEQLLTSNQGKADGRVARQLMDVEPGRTGKPGTAGAMGEGLFRERNP